MGGERLGREDEKQNTRIWTIIFTLIINDMKSFTITITRSSYSTKTYTVQSEDREGAREQAMDMAVNVTFSEQGADYDVEDICESE